VNGKVQVTLDCEPRFEYGRLTGSGEYDGPGYHRAQCSCAGTELTLKLTSDINLGFAGARATGRTLMKEGDTLFVALSWSEHPAPDNYERPDDRLVWTAHHWQHWLDHGTFPDHPWRTHLQRSALTLKGLSYAPSGALVAAATTSLPESPGGERNWDYRYTWIRDATFMLLGSPWRGQALHLVQADVLGGLPTAALDGPRCATSSSSRRVGSPPRRRSRPTSWRTRSTTRGVFCQHYDTDALDASVLLMTLTRFLPPEDERIRATVLAVADELTDDGLVLRYRVDETDDGLAGEEGTFTICSFWLVSALVEIGEVERGRDLCEKLLSYSSPLGLYAEEIDPRTGRHLGNFPQAFTHLALINAVMHVIRADQGLEAGMLPLGRELTRQRSQRS
jgi:GH15 family glucan-1,4-alpha-glucosidase